MSSKSLSNLRERLTSKLGYKPLISNKYANGHRHLIYGNVTNKLQQYQWFHDHEVPALPFTTDKEIVYGWLQEGSAVVARTLLSSSEGKGIVVFQDQHSFVEAKVYTKYLPKKKEFRVHIFDNQVVVVLEKRRKKGLFNGNYKIRNSKNGYVFCREDVEEPEGIRELALKARKITDSHFVGVDIGYNEKHNKLFVIEVNSAPGMENSTLDDYAQAIYSTIL